MSKILGISGSLRSKSFNTALLRVAAELTPADCEIEVGSIKGIPLYDGDLESAEGAPPVVTALRERLLATDALLLATPEYNGSLPGVLKNAIDWLSRPAQDKRRPFSGRAVGMMGATPGRMGTVFSQTAWLQVFRSLGMRPWFGKTVYVGGASRLFDDAGNLTDEPTRERVRDYLEGFADFLKT